MNKQLNFWNKWKKELVNDELRRVYLQKRHKTTNKYVI
jgi:hypothetical protein